MKKNEADGPLDPVAYLCKGTRWPNNKLPAHYAPTSFSRSLHKTQLSISTHTHTPLSFSLSLTHNTANSNSIIITVRIISDTMHSSGEDDSDNPATTAGAEWTFSARNHAPSSDPCWKAIERGGGTLGLGDLRFVQRVGSGDIGSVYLVELKGSNGCLFAAKVMDKKELVARNKDTRAKVEREILQAVDHPFLPTLYASLDSPRWSCLLTEFCPGGDLHVLRQRQPDKRFHHAAVRSVVCLSFNSPI